MKENLTEAEFMIMQVMWQQNEPIMMGEMLDEVNRRFGKDWKPQTISTYITRLLNKGFLNKDRFERFARYSPAVSYDEYKSAEIEEFAKKWGSDSLKQFATALNKNQPITHEQRDELREFLDGLD